MLTPYALPDMLERLYENQLALEAAIMELSLWTANHGAPWKPSARMPGTSNRPWPS